MKRLADRFDEASERCQSIPELSDLLLSAARELGFDFVALLDHASLLHPSSGYIRIDNYPPEWVDELTSNGRWRSDPVHLASRRTSVAFLWRKLASLAPLGRPQQEILQRSAYFGIGEGLTVPVNVPGEPAGSCSFAVRRGSALPEQRLACAELIGAHAFAIARSLSRSSPENKRPHLSRRELECLRLVAAGKSDAEIGLILGLSVETVHQYVKRARAAYDVVTRTQLVVLGLRDNWLDFEEALDPRV